MNPDQLGRHYDEIAGWWDAQRSRTGGLQYLQRAIALAPNREKALDVGCGNGRLTSLIAAAGFPVVGVDVSEGMLRFARREQPNATFIHADICEWQPIDRYDLIVAWDSTFHVPHAAQRDVVAKLCQALTANGILLFTAGGVDGEITGEMNGVSFYYSSLTDTEYLRALGENGCTCILLERDQYPENHIVVIASRTA